MNEQIKEHARALGRETIFPASAIEAWLKEAVDYGIPLDEASRLASECARGGVSLGGVLAFARARR